jgi:hypothetical protein
MKISFKPTIYAALLLALGGCAGVISSGINQVGPDTYTTTVRAGRSQGGVIGAEGIALDEAGQHCRRLGREILVLTSSTATGAYQATFRCLRSDDPDWQRPNILPAPDRIIEQRQRTLQRP